MESGNESNSSISSEPAVVDTGKETRMQRARKLVTGLFKLGRKNKSVSEASAAPTTVDASIAENKPQDPDSPLDLHPFTASLRSSIQSDKPGESINYEQSQVIALADRLDTASEAYKQVFEQVTSNVSDERKKLFIQQFNQGNPVLLKSLTLFLVDQKQTEGAKEGIQELADLKNINGALDQILLKQYNGQVDLRAAAAFANKDINIALRPEPLFQEKPTEVQQAEPQPEEHAPFTVIKGGKEDEEDKTA